MPDTTLDIGVRGGREGKAIIDAVTQALRLLGQQNLANARDAKGAASASAQQASTLRGLANAARDSLQNQTTLLNNLKATAEATAAASKTAREEADKAARVYKQSAIEIATGLKKMTEARLKLAEADKISVKLPTGGTATTVANPALISMLKEKIRLQNEDLARARALGNLQIKNAQQVGVAEERSANRRVASQQKVVDKVKETSKQSTQAAKDAERAALSQERAAARATASLRAQQQGAAAVQAGLNALRNTVLRLVAAYSGFQAIKGFVTAGLEFNRIIETSKLGIAALITATADLTDQQGNQLSGTKALGAAQVLAADQLTKLRIAGIQTAATTEELVTAFQEAVAAGLAVGLTLDQIRIFTVQVAQAATTIGLPFNQLNQEVRSILNSTIDRNSRIAKALQLTNAEINQAKEQGRLADLLNEKFKAFNIAGVESVKTFTALKSNIKDAFQLLAGEATIPLFETLRDAGQAALVQIFDFKTAAIQQSFQGLVKGAQVIFKEIGSTLADAIAFGVNKAKALSEFFDKNKQTVKDTAAALGTMVRTFGEMITSIGSSITGLITFGHQTNTIIGLARILDAVFASVRDHIGAILFALTAQSLIKAIGGIVAGVIALRGAVAGAVTGAELGSVVPGIGTAIGALVGLLVGGSIALKIFKRDEKEVALETARTTTVMQDQQRATADLVAQFVELQRQLDDQKLSDQDREILQTRMNELLKQFTDQTGPLYLDLIKRTNKEIEAGTLSLKDQRVALIALMQEQVRDAAANEARARSRVTGLQEELNLLEKQPAKSVTRGVGKGAVTFVDPEAAAHIQEVEAALAAAKEEAKKLTAQTDALKASLDRAAPPPIIKKRVTPDAGAGGEAPAIKAAKAELERTKAELDAARAKVNAEFAARLVDGETRLRQLLQIDLAEVAAEHKLLEAERREAERKRDIVVKGETPAKKSQRVQAAQDVVNAILIQEQSLGFKAQELQATANGELIKLANDRADKEEAIRIRVLRATGRILDAELAETALKQKQALREFDDENGQLLASLRGQMAGSVALSALGFSAADRQKLQDQINHQLDLKADIKVAVDHESFDAALTSLNTEVQRILETRTAEEQAIRSRFKLSRKLSAAEKQQLADEIAAADQRAVDATQLLRLEVLQLAAAAADVGDRTALAGFDALLAKLDAMKEKVKTVDQEMEKLKDGLRSALEGGISTFFEEIGDRTKTLADLFHDMVTSILKDMQRLISQLIAQRIVQWLFKLIGSLGKSAAEKLVANDFGISPPERLAGGGRPGHGRLQGGIPGIDSIPILAQQDEWFLRPSVRRKYGDAFLRELNELRLPIMPIMSREQFVRRHTERFAQGGAVDFTREQQTARESRPQEISLNIGVDRGGMLRVWQGPVGKKLVTDHVKASRRELGNILIPRQRPA